MTQNTGSGNTVAPLTNVALFMETVDRVMNRTPGLPGLATFYGPSGWGKTTAAKYAANKHRAHMVRVQSTWGQKALCEAIAKELSLKPERTISKIVDQIVEQLAADGRPLLIDEADYLVQKRMIDIIRDIHDGAQAGIVLCGEEAFPMKLRTTERVAGRVIKHSAAQPVSLGDIGHLARLHLRGIAAAEDLLAAIHAAVSGSARWAVNNLDEIRHTAAVEGRTEVDLAWWGDRGLFTGHPPQPRRG